MNFDCGIYCITGPNGMRYIGSSKTIAIRWGQHKSALRYGKHKNPHLQHAWKAHGEDAFTFSKIAFVPLDDLIRTEQAIIDAYPPRSLYNVCMDVRGVRKGIPHSPETIEKIRIASTGRKASAETRARISAANKGKRISEEQRRAVSIARTGLKHTPETIQKLRLANRGRTLTDHQKARLGAGLKRHYAENGSHLSKRVMCIETGEWFVSATKAAEWLVSLGLAKNPQSVIGSIFGVGRGKRKSICGYSWRIAGVFDDMYRNAEQVVISEDLRRVIAL
jgi:group I intron endonuclease